MVNGKMLEHVRKTLKNPIWCFWMCLIFHSGVPCFFKDTHGPVIWGMLSLRNCPICDFVARTLGGTIWCNPGFSPKIPRMMKQSCNVAKAYVFALKKKGGFAETWWHDVNIVHDFWASYAVNIAYMIIYIYIITHIFTYWAKQKYIYIYTHMYLHLSFGIGGGEFGAGDVPSWKLSTTTKWRSATFQG